MSAKLSKFFYRISSWPVVIISLGLFLIFAILFLPAQSSRMQPYSGQAGSPDVTFFYSAADLHNMAEVYGETGRNAYIHARFTFDLVFPLVYLFFLITCLGWSLERSLPVGNRWRQLNLLPILGWFFDMLENISASAVMWSFPKRYFFLEFITPIFSGFKWIFIFASFLILLFAILFILWRRIKGLSWH